MTNQPLESKKFVANYTVKSLISNLKIMENNFNSFNIKRGEMKNSKWENLPRILLQLCVLGESGVGKTNLLSALEHGTVPSTLRLQPSTIGVSCRFFHLDRLFRDRFVVSIRIDDTGGEEKFRSITPMYIRRADGILFIADATEVRSLTELERYWIEEVKKIKTSEYESVLICNKLDAFEKNTENYRIDFLHRATEIATRHEISLFSTSAHRGDNVQESMKNILLRIFENESLMDKLMNTAMAPTHIEHEERRKKIEMLLKNEFFFLEKKLVVVRRFARGWQNLISLFHFFVQRNAIERKTDRPIFTTNTNQSASLNFCFFSNRSENRCFVQTCEW